MAYSNNASSIYAIVRGLHKHGAVQFTWVSDAPGRRVELIVQLFYGVMQINGEAPAAQPRRLVNISIPSIAVRSVSVGYPLSTGFFFQSWTASKSYSEDVIAYVDADFVAMINKIQAQFVDYLVEHGDPVKRLEQDAGLHPGVEGLTLTLSTE